MRAEYNCHFISGNKSRDRSVSRHCGTSFVSRLTFYRHSLHSQMGCAGIYLVKCHSQWMLHGLISCSKVIPATVCKETVYPREGLNGQLDVSGLVPCLSTGIGALFVFVSPRGGIGL